MTVAEQLKQEGKIETAREMAKKLLVMGDPIAKIAMVTGLSEEEILTLKKEIK